MINSISGTTSLNFSTMSGVGGPQGAHRSNPFEAVSDLLGMSASEIAGQVKSGKSLDDLAQTKGVSHDDLIAALKAGAPQGVKGGDFDAMVEKLASKQGMQGPMGPPPGPPPGGMGGLLDGGTVSESQQSVLDSLSELLDMSSEELQDELTSGTDLSSLLQDKGVSLSDLASVIEAGFLVDVRA
jgi:lambda repressor-like predicted transcriptional regulator